MAKFIIKQRSNGQYQFNLKASNGEIILTSEGYTSKTGCVNGINSVKTNSINDNNYSRKMSTSGKYYFNLRSMNGEVIGISEMYNSIHNMENGIEAVKFSAPRAFISE